jgi:hypothetical protein
MDDKKEHPPPAANRGRVQKEELRASSLPLYQPYDSRQLGNGCVEVTYVETLIGRAYIGIEIEQHINDPNILRIVQRPYKSGPRKGQLHPVRLHYENRDRRERRGRTSDPVAAAKAFHTLHRTLGIGPAGMAGMFGGSSLRLMGTPHFTPAGATSKTGQDFASALRRHGIKVASEPTLPRAPDEFWWLDMPW